VLYVGRLATEKRLDVLIRAVAALRSSLDAQLVLVGKGESEPYREIADEAAIAERCTFHGPVADEDLPDVYRAATVFGFPSEAELQGMVLLEAAASGLPLVGADQYAIPEIIHHGVNGYLHAPGDVEGCAEALERVLESERIRKRMGQFAIRGAAEHSLSEVAARTERLYESVVSGERTRRLARTA
jgi:glycosyltransferase involved in cell wall biosynthesis